MIKSFLRNKFWKINIHILLFKSLEKPTIISGCAEHQEKKIACADGTATALHRNSGVRLIKPSRGRAKGENKLEEANPIKSIFKFFSYAFEIN